MDVAILTPIEVEYRTFRDLLPHWEKKIVKGCVYEWNTLKGKYYNYQIVIRLTGSKNKEIALETRQLLNHFSPQLLILSGIAGGIKDVQIGDIVVGTMAYGYESGKIISNGNMVSRPEVIEYDYQLMESLRVFVREHWADKSHKVIFGPIASGDKVIASTHSELYAFIKQHYNDTTAIEMESIGFATACKRERALRFLNIRSISDLLEDKTQTDQAGGQEKAVEHVAAFVFTFLKALDFETIKIYVMDSKTLVKKVANTLFAEKNLSALLNEFSKRDNELAKSIYYTVKPLITNELQLLKADPQDEDDTLERVRVNFKDKLREEMKTESILFQRLEAIMNHKTLTNKNTITNSTLTAGNDINIGDQTTTIGQQVNNYGEVGKQVNIKDNQGDLHF